MKAMQKEHKVLKNWSNDIFPEVHYFCDPQIVVMTSSFTKGYTVLSIKPDNRVEIQDHATGDIETLHGMEILRRYMTLNRHVHEQFFKFCGSRDLKFDRLFVIAGCLYDNGDFDRDFEISVKDDMTHLYVEIDWGHPESDVKELYLKDGFYPDYIYTYENKDGYNTTVIVFQNFVTGNFLDYNVCE